MSKSFSSSSFTLIDDSGANQSITNLNLLSIFSGTDIYFYVVGATSEIKTTVPLELVNNAYTLAILRYGTRLVLK